MVAVILLTAACGADSVPPELQPDSVLVRELGLTEDDRVHTVLVTADTREVASPDSVAVDPGAWVEFVAGDWRVHEVRFEVDSLPAAARAFLESTDQAASPPLLDRGARFLVSFEEAPAGAYPFVVEGNLPAARGVVLVRPAP